MKNKKIMIFLFVLVFSILCIDNIIFATEVPGQTSVEVTAIPKPEEDLSGQTSVEVTAIPKPEEDLSGQTSVAPTTTPKPEEDLSGQTSVAPTTTLETEKSNIETEKSKNIIKYFSIVLAILVVFMFLLIIVKKK